MEDHNTPEREGASTVGRPASASSERVEKIITKVRHSVGFNDLLHFTLQRLWLPLFQVIGQLFSDLKRRPPRAEGSHEPPHR